MGFEWNQGLSVGFREIDDQHKELFAAVNRLLDTASQGKGRDEVGKTIEFLGRYVVAHFGMEERYMIKYGYPNLSSHRAVHKQFIDEFSNIKKKFDAEGASGLLVVIIQRKVCDWLINHVGKTDKALGVFLQANA